MDHRIISEDKQQFDEMVAEFEASEVQVQAYQRMQENIIPLFWVYYPHAREILKKGQALIIEIHLSISLLMILLMLEDLALLYTKGNVYENREVKDYIKNNSFMRLLESERIKKRSEILNTICIGS